MADAGGEDETVPPAQAHGADADADPSPSEPAPQNTSGASDQPRTIGGFIVDDEDDEEYTPMLASKTPEASDSGLGNVDRGTSNTPQPPPALPAEHSVPTHEIPTNTAQEKHDDSGATEPGHDASSTLFPSLPTSGLTAEHDAGSSTPLNVPAPAQSPAVSTTNASQPPIPKARLPNDRVGILEDRIKDDPRGDIDAWLALIDEHKKRNKLDEARAAYDRFFKVFPSAADQLVAYANMELEHNDFYRVEQIFNKYLLNVPNVQLWSTYLNYVRRRNNLTTDSSGNARKVVTETYEFVLQNIGIDKDSGPVWQDYVQFLRSGPEQIGGTSWQDQQKMDTLRRVYQRAICVPTQAVTQVWKEYDTFEMGINKQTGRKFLQEKSASYMTARSAYTALQNLTRELHRTTLPRLPPAPGFDGDVEFTRQVDLWKKWIEWEKEDPLVLKDEDVKAFHARILYVYKQALMALRFWPEMWVDAAEFCFANGLEQDGNDFISQGITANPESCLLAFERADRIESTTTKEESEESIVQRGAAVRDPYDKVLDALYELCAKVKQQETQAVARIEEAFPKDSHPTTTNGDEPGDDEEAGQAATADSEAARKAQVEAVRNGFAAQLKVLSKTISFVWIALMRAMRRVQGKGKLGETIGGSRQIFADARKRGRLTSDVYVASAMIEYHCYKDPAATKIFERGMKLYPEDEFIALEFIKHLIATNDITNARSVFETSVTRLTQNPLFIPRSKPLFAYFHEYESHYGELSQINKLEKRMQEFFPEDSKLRLFSQRFTNQDFDPTAIRPIISPATQARPRSLGPGKPDGAASLQNSPRPAVIVPPQITLSPKRPLEESDTESLPAKKLPRSESPLKGAAGRRLDAQKRTNLRTQVSQNNSQSATPLAAGPTPLPPELYYLLSIIPRAETYNATPFNPEKMVELLRNIDLSKAKVHQQQPVHLQAPQPFGYQQQNPNFPYLRQ